MGKKRVYEKTLFDKAVFQQLLLQPSRGPRSRLLQTLQPTDLSTSEFPSTVTFSHFLTSAQKKLIIHQLLAKKHRSSVFRSN